MDEKRTTIIEELTQLTKNALYRTAQVLGIPRRSLMSKSELVDALSQRQEDAEPIIQNLKKSAQKKYAEVLNQIPSASKGQKATVSHGKSAPSKEPSPVQRATGSGMEPTSESLTSSVSEKEPEETLREPESVWVGEEGPDLPVGYGVTVLRAMARDPHWVFLYWEISEETRNQIRAEEHEWYFDTSEALLRVFDAQGECIQETAVLLDAHGWYLNLTPSRTYEFEIGLKNREGVYRSITRSKKLTLPPIEPSPIIDDQWAMVSEEFEEVIYQPASLEHVLGVEKSSLVPQLLRQRMRVPWTLSQERGPSSHMWPSSHIFPSSHTLIDQ